MRPMGAPFEAPALLSEIGMADSGMITHIQRFSTHDGPGIRTTVFLKGCPLTCPWCHNPENQAHDSELLVRADRCIGCAACVDACPVGAIQLFDTGPTVARERCTTCGACAEQCYTNALSMTGRPATVESVIEALERDRPFFDTSGGGVTFSGGEPLAQPAFLAALVEACRFRAIHTAVDTCGFAPWDALNGVRNAVDLFLYDVKLVDEERHKRYTGVSNRLIMSNLRRLVELGHRVILRFPLVPGVNDAPVDLDPLAALAKGTPRLEGVDVLPYHRMAIGKYQGLGKPFELAGLDPPTGEKVAEAVEILERSGLPVRIGG